MAEIEVLAPGGNPEMTQADLEQLKAWRCSGEEKLFAAVYFPFEFKYIRMHTNFVGYSISCECPVSEDFHNYI